MRSAWLVAMVTTGVCGAATVARAPSQDVPSPTREETARPLPNGHEMVRSMVDRQRSFEEAIDDYTYDVVTTEQKLDGDDRVKESHVRRHQVFFVKGEPVRKLVEEDGRPLPPGKAAKEEKRVVREAEKARRRKDPSDKEKDDGAVRISEVLARFDCTAVARETIGDRSAVVVTFKPLPGKRSIKQDNVLRALQGRLWIDEEARAVVRAELSSNQKIKMAGGLLLSISNFDVTLDFVPVDEIWLPRRSEAFVAGRVLLVKGLRERVIEEYSNYRRFVVSTEEKVVGSIWRLARPQQPHGLRWPRPVLPPGRRGLPPASDRPRRDRLAAVSGFQPETVRLSAVDVALSAARVDEIARAPGRKRGGRVTALLPLMGHGLKRETRQVDLAARLVAFHLQV